MSRTIGILLFDDVEELDFAGPWEVFGAAASGGAELQVVTISQTGALVRCAQGLRVQPDHSFADAPVLDIVLVPGGQGTRREVSNTALIGWLRTVGGSCEWVTSVCTGSLLLHGAGLVDGKRITTHHAFIETLRGLGGSDVVGGVRYVRDGNLVTAAGVSAGIDMALWLLGQLFSPELARAVTRGIEYDPAPPYLADV